MSDPVNLNKWRKSKARQEKRRQADRNAVVHGLPKSEKLAARKAAHKAKVEFDGKMLPPK